MIAEASLCCHAILLGQLPTPPYRWRMRALLFCLVFFAALPAGAGQTEARAVALASGCKPTKIEVLRQTFGTTAATTYKVTCENKAPAASGSTPTPPELRVRCQGKLCTAF